jgi:regulatory protein
MKIEKISRMKNGKYKIELEGKEKLVTFDDVIINNSLLFDKKIDNTLMNKILKETEYYEVYNKTIKYISNKLRSEKEVIEFIDKYSLSNKDSKEIINNLKKIGFINDELFTKAYINDKLYLSNSGPEKIKKELYDYNIDEMVIEREMESINYEEVYSKLEKLITKKINANHKHSNYTLKQKLNLELVNAGYNRDMINEIYNKNMSEDEDILIKTYEKLYNDLQRKYSDKELFKKIKEKLYQKGFDINEINELLNNKIDM